MGFGGRTEVGGEGMGCLVRCWLWGFIDRGARAGGSAGMPEIEPCWGC